MTAPSRMSPKQSVNCARAAALFSTWSSTHLRYGTRTKCVRRDICASRLMLTLHRCCCACFDQGGILLLRCAHRYELFRSSTIDDGFCWHFERDANIRDLMNFECAIFICRTPSDQFILARCVHSVSIVGHRPSPPRLPAIHRGARS